MKGDGEDTLKRKMRNLSPLLLPAVFLISIAFVVFIEGRSPKEALDTWLVDRARRLIWDIPLFTFHI